MNGIRRRCCKRLIPETDIFRSSAASAMVSKSIAGLESIGILVKERYRIGE
jgi:hypothetical protein